MPIELQYENMDALPEAFRNEAVFNELFTQKEDGSIVVTGVTGMKTINDVQSVQEALRKERDDHKSTKNKYKPLAEMDLTEVLTKLDRIDELEAAAGGQLDEEKINGIVESRLGQKTGPLQREIDTLKETNAELLNSNKELKSSIDTRDRNDVIVSAATENKAHSTAVEDIKLTASVMLEKDESGNWVTKEGIEGVTPGLGIKDWMKEMVKLRPHWWPESEGGGSRGTSGIVGFTGDNPFSSANWNLTKQGEIVRTKGQEFASRLAKQAGTTVGGPRPTK